MAGTRLHLRRGPQRRQWAAIPIVGMVLLVLGVWMQSRPGDHQSTRAWLLSGWTIGIGVAFLLMRWIAYLTQYLLFRSRPDRDIAVTFTFSEEGLARSSALSSGRSLWGAFVGALASGRGLLLYLNDRAFIWTPASAFADPADYARLLTLVASKVPKFRQVT
jgi:hypothetical protein